MKLGIDMGGMSIKMGLVNEENEIIGRITIPTDLTVPYQMLVERMADAVQQMLENAGMTLEQCEGIGIGSPGTIDAKRGVILYSNNFGWENVPIVEELKNIWMWELKLPMMRTLRHWEKYMPVRQKVQKMQFF